MKILSGLILVVALAACQFPVTPPVTGDVEIAVGSGGMIARSLDHGETWEVSVGNQSKTWNNGRTNLVVDGELQVNGELNKGRFAQIDALASAVSQMQTTGFLGDLHVRGTLYQQLGQQWVGPIANPFGANTILGIAYGNGVFVAVATGPEIARSTDLGVTWSALIANPFGAGSVRGIAYGNSVFVAVGDNGGIARSTDFGATWGALIGNPFGGAVSIRSVAFGNGVFIAVGDSGQIARSTDNGVTWGALIGNPFGVTGIYSVSFGVGVFVAVGQGAKIARSEDFGVTWGSLITNPFNAVNIATGSVFGNGVFVAVTTGFEIARSVDLGKTWGSLIANPFTSSIFSVSYNFGMFQVGAGLGQTARSYDNGITWGSLIAAPFGGAINAIASSPSNLCAVGTGGKIATAGWNAAYSLVEPVPGEPSLGTPHWHGNSVGAGTLINATNPGSGTWVDVTFSNAPAGATCAHAVCQNLNTLGAANFVAVAARKKGDTVAYGNVLIQIGNTSGSVIGLVKIPLNSSKQGQVAADWGAANSQLRVYDAIFYDC